VTPDVVVEHDPEHSRFVIRDEHGIAELVYDVIGSQIFLRHTEVPKALEGRGLGGALAHEALEYARAHDLSVVPICRFVIDYLSRHPEYQFLVKDNRFAKGREDE
jgi:predicted GNAT family acetyltransferase